MFVKNKKKNIYNLENKIFLTIIKFSNVRYNKRNL